MGRDQQHLPLTVRNMLCMRNVLIHCAAARSRQVQSTGRRQVKLLLPLCLLTIAGCTGSAPPPQPVLNAAELEAAATYRVGEGAGTPLAEVQSVIAFAPDSILVLDSAEPFLRLYGTGGVVRLEAGNRGGGPGEFVRPGFLRAFGDTLWAMDWGTGLFARWRHSHRNPRLGTKPAGGSRLRRRRTHCG